MRDDLVRVVTREGEVDCKVKKQGETSFRGVSSTGLDHRS